MSTPENSLAAIVTAFNDRFRNWNLELPPEAIAGHTPGHLRHGSWSIWFRFDRDALGEYLDYYLAGRRGDDTHERLRADGTHEDLPVIVHSWVEGVDRAESVRREQALVAENQRVVELLAAKGFGLQGDEPGGGVLNPRPKPPFSRTDADGPRETFGERYDAILRQAVQAAPPPVRHEPPASLSVEGGCWRIPDPRHAYEGLLVGMPSNADMRRRFDEALQRRATWAPGAEARALLGQLMDYVGHRIEVQFWTSIMSEMPEMGPCPLVGDCTGLVVLQHEGFPQAYLVLEGIEVQKTPEGSSPLSLLTERPRISGQLAPVANLDEIRRAD